MTLQITVRYNSWPTRKFQKLDDLGAVLNLTGYVIKLIVKPFLSNEDGVLPDSRAWVDVAATITRATSGKYEFNLTAAETALPAGRHPAEVRFWRPPDAPTTAPADALAGAGAGNVDNGLHTYRVTYVSPKGESSGSPVSDGVTVADKTVNGKVAVSAIPVGPSDTTARKLYRTIAGNTGDHKLVATISDNVTTTYEDNIADGSLGAALAAAASTNPPPFDAEVGEYVVEEEVDGP